MINFRISEALIEQIKLAVKVFGEVYVLGDGNFYTDKEACLTQKKFCPAENEEATFMLSFFKESEVPDTVDAFENMFFESRKNEIKEVKDTAIRADRNVLTMPKKEAVKVEEPEIKEKEVPKVPKVKK